MLEILLDPLAALVVTFFVMSIISVISVLLMYLMKNEKVKKVLFYFLCVWGVVISWCNVLGTPGYWFEEILIALGLGALGIVALLIQLISKKENKFEIARILVTISVVVGMIDCFLI